MEGIQKVSSAQEGKALSQTQAGETTATDGGASPIDEAPKKDVAMDEGVSLDELGCFTQG
jgi:hypothetical protein